MDESCLSSHGVMGLALNLEESQEVLLLGEYTKIREGDSGQADGRIMEVPGRRSLGRDVSERNWRKNH